LDAAVQMDTTREKFREARLNFERLRELTRSDEFYAAVNAFLSAAYSVLYIAEHQFGLPRSKKAQAALPPNDRAERQRFDQWFKSSQHVSAVKSHPLGEDRHVVIHRVGQAGFVHLPKPIGGLAVEHGTPFRPAIFLNGNGVGLPLEDDNSFLYIDSAGKQHEAIPYCEAYLALIQRFFQELDKRPWA
jgi:hypothetical protein